MGKATKEPCYWRIMKMPRLLTANAGDRGEFILTEILERAGYEVYCPFRTEFRYLNRFDKAQRKKKTERKFPLIVGYLFLRVTPPQEFDLFRRGLISRFLGRDGMPYGYSDQWIRLLRQCYGVSYNAALDPSRTPHSAPQYEAYMQTYGEFKAGDDAVVYGGSLDGWEVKVVEIEDTKARIMFNLFGREQLQTVPLHSLIRSDAA